MSVDELKAKGNALFSAGNYDEAIGWFTKAIDAGGNHVLAAPGACSAAGAALHRAGRVLALDGSLCASTYFGSQLLLCDGNGTARAADEALGAADFVEVRAARAGLTHAYAGRDCHPTLGACAAACRACARS